MAFGVAAYLCWGFFPLYWPLLDPAGALEVLAHRFVWSMVFVLIAITVMGRWRPFVVIARDRRMMLILTAASIAIAVNWGSFIWGVTNGHVIETSLGYFINPLVTVLLAVFVLKERLRRAQWVAVAIGSIAVVVLAIDYGRLPWVALIVAFSFATYGFLKKKAELGAFEGLGMETAILFPVALAFLLALQVRGELDLRPRGTGQRRAADRHGHRHRDPAAAVRRGRDPALAHDARHPAVPRPGPAVHHRADVLRRGR